MVLDGKRLDFWYHIVTSAIIVLVSEWAHVHDYSVLEWGQKCCPESGESSALFVASTLLGLSLLRCWWQKKLTLSSKLWFPLEFLVINLVTEVLFRYVWELFDDLVYLLFLKMCMVTGTYQMETELYYLTCFLTSLVLFIYTSNVTFQVARDTYKQTAKKVPLSSEDRLLRNFETEGPGRTVFERRPDVVDFGDLAEFPN